MGATSYSSFRIDCRHCLCDGFVAWYRLFAFDQIRLLSGENNSDIPCSDLLMIVASTGAIYMMSSVLRNKCVARIRNIPDRRRQHCCCFAFLDIYMVVGVRLIGINHSDCHPSSPVYCRLKKR